MNKRFIKNENFPLTNMPSDAPSEPSNHINKPVCLNKIIFDNKLKIVKTGDCQPIISTIISQNIYNPPIGIFSSDILSIYNIESIDSLYIWIDNNLIRNIKSQYKNDNAQYNINTINRVLKCWIRVNFDILKTNHRFLEKVINKVIEIHYSEEQISNNINNLNKETHDFINYWIDKNILTEKKDYNLLFDYFNYLNTKFKFKFL